MNCSELTNDRLLDFADWELPPNERKGIARHLDTCAPCRTRRDDLEGMAGALRHDLEGPPPGLLAELDAAVLGRALTTARRRRPPWRPFLAGAAAALVVAALAWVVTNLPGRFVTRPVPEPQATAAPPAPPAQVTNLPGSFVAEPATLQGDLNGDGVVDIADARMIQQRVLAGLPAPAQADVNGDGLVDIADVRWITRHEVAAR